MSTIPSEARPFVVRYGAQGERSKAEFATRSEAQAFRKATPGAGPVELPEIPVRHHAGIFRRGDSYVVRYKKDNGKTTRKSCKSLAEARDFQLHAKHSVRLGDFLDPKDRKVTFGTWAAEWVRTLRCAESTKRRWAGVVRNHLVPTFGDALVGNIRPSHVNAWLNDQEAKLAPKTVKMHCEVLQAIFKAAQEDRIINASPVDGVKRPKAPKAVEHVLTDAQVAAIADALPERWQLVVWLGAMAGLRIGETMGVTLDCIDFEGKRLRISKAWKHEGGFGTTKTCKSRWVPVTDGLLGRIEAHVERFGTSDEGTLFHSAVSSKAPTLSSFYNNVWAKWVRPLGLGKDIGSPHALRHFYASVLIRQGVDIRTVQEALGHASASITLDKYAHLMPGSDGAIRDAFDARFTPGLRVVA